jgi:phospholipid transport system substrate-binding protein
MTIDSASQGDTHLGRDRGRETLGDRGRARMAWFSPGGIGRMLLALAMAGVTVGASPALGMSTGPATEAIRDTISQVIRLLEDPNLKGPGKAGERRRLLERTIGNRFSYAEMAKRSLGAHWRGLTAAEQEEFVALFQRLLSKTYAHTIEGYAGEQVQYLGERIAEEIAEVRTKIVSDKVEVPVGEPRQELPRTVRQDPPLIVVCRPRRATAEEGGGRSAGP